ncbi:hypothetical protein CIW50_27720 [Tardiphaga sp. P9-11]|nr:hypothetical protein CIW50_27720 [Tardiphaga sp. P9-11]
MGSDEDIRDVTLEDLRRRFGCPELEYLEVEKEPENEDRPPSRGSGYMSRWETLIMGVIGSLLASWIWAAIWGGSSGM